MIPTAWRGIVRAECSNPGEVRALQVGKQASLEMRQPRIQQFADRSFCRLALARIAEPYQLLQPREPSRNAGHRLLNTT